jgi:hypothetical protein
MKLSAPKQTTFWIAVVIAAIGLISGLITIPVLSPLALWIVVVGFVVLAAGNMLENL